MFKRNTSSGERNGRKPPTSGHARGRRADPKAVGQLHDSLYGMAPVFGFNQYGKASLGFLALKDLMGAEAFKRGLHLFMTRWAGKRLLPWDMFASFNAAGAGDLD
jgi:hypothetical protein